MQAPKQAATAHVPAPREVGLPSIHGHLPLVSPLDACLYPFTCECGMQLICGKLHNISLCLGQVIA